MNKYDLFLSYNWRDRQDAERIARQLKDRGLRVFLDRWYLVPGRPWIEALEELIEDCGAVAILLGPNGMGSWQQREKNLAISRQARDANLPVIPVLLPGADSALGFLSLETWVDLRGGEDDEAFEVLVLAARGEPRGSDVRNRMQMVRSSVCPYRGLRPFREEDAAFFFGREDYTRRLVKMVEQHALIAVVGASGSGKSSVVRAGLVPAVRRGISNKFWEVATLVPGESPLRSLAAALLPFLEPEMTEVARLREVRILTQTFQNEEVRLYDVVARVLEKQRGTDRLLLVVDQWEEIYTLCKDDRTRIRFIDEVLDATQRGSLDAVLTLRGDFYSRVLDHRLMANRLQNQVMNLGPMTRKELGRIIEKPAQKVSLTMESGLKERILNDVGEAPGILPYLEFVLTRLWEERRAGALTHAAYESLGETESGRVDSGESPMQRVIAAYAERQLEKLLDSGHEEETLRRLLLQLVQPVEEHEATRRRAALAGIGEKERNLVRPLADARLLVTGRDEASGEETVEVAHEALIGSWQRLKNWMDQDREFLLWRRRVEAANESWQATGKDKSALLRGGSLAEAKRWASERSEELSAQTLGFIGTSEQAELKNSRSRKTVFGAATAAFILTIIFAVIASQRQNEARRLLAENHWSSGQKAVENRDLLGASHLFARSASNFREDARIRTARIRLSTLGSVALLRRFDHEGLVNGAVFSRDESRVLSWSDDGTVRLWNPVDQFSAALLMKHEEPVLGAVFSRDERRVLSWGKDGTVRLWNATDGSPAAPPLKHDENVWGAILSRDERRVLSWSGDVRGRSGAVRLWNAADALPAAPLMKHDGAVKGAVFSQDERRVLSWSRDRTVRLWNAADGSPAAPPLKHNKAVQGAVFSRDNGRVLSWSEDGTVRLWKVADGTLAAPPMQHDCAVGGAVFNRDESRMLSWSGDWLRGIGSVHVWNAVDGSLAAPPMKHEDMVLGAIFSRDESRVLSWSRDGTVRLRDAVDGSPVAPPMKHGGVVLGAIFSRDESQVLSWSAGSVESGGLVRLWKAADGSPVAPFMNHDGTVRGAVFSGDGSRVLSWSADKTVRLWKAVDRMPTAALLKHEGTVRGAVFSPDGSRVLSWGADRTVRLWKAVDGSPAAAPLRHGGMVWRAVFSPDGSRVLSSSADKTVRLWNVADGTPATPLMNHDGTAYGAAFSRDGSRVLSWSADRTVRLWSSTDGSPAATPMRHDGAVHGAVFSPDGSRVLSWSEDGTVRRWNAADGSPAGPPMRHDGAVNGAAFSPDGGRVLSWSRDRTVRLWNAADGSPATPPMKHDREVKGAFFNRDGSRVLSWSAYMWVRLWDAADGSPAAPSMKHDGAVNGAVFDRGASRVLSWSGALLGGSGMVHLWKMVDGSAAAPPMKHDGVVWGAVFSRDESRVLSWSGDGTLRLWNAVDSSPAAPAMKHDGVVRGAVFNRDESRVLSWSKYGTVRLWNLQADFDFPHEHLTLLVEVVTGTQLDDSGNVTVLDGGTWRTKKTEYIQIAEKHWKSCRYKDANIYAVQREYWSQEEN